MSQKNNDRMAHFYYEKNDALFVNKYKILEPSPQAKKIDDIALIQMIICPLISFDNLGNRLGYGKGYYDEFLSTCNPQAIKVGLSFFSPHSTTIPTDAHDIRLSHCITPQGIITF